MLRFADYEESEDQWDCDGGLVYTYVRKEGTIVNGWKTAWL